MSGSKRGYMSHDNCEILTWILCGCLLFHNPFPRVGLVTDKMVTERDCWMMCHSRHINGMVGLWAGLICVSGASLLLGNRGCWMKLFTWHPLLELTLHLLGVPPYEPRRQIIAPSTFDLLKMLFESRTHVICLVLLTKLQIGTMKCTWDILCNRYIISWCSWYTMASF
jgi:hypothetical protein